MPNHTLLCPSPFLSESAYSATGGYVEGRFCGPFSESLYCCLPCPLQQWVYSNGFQQKANLAYWFNVPGFIAQVFLLVSFAVLREEESRGHYMSVGLCLALMMLELSFIIPLGTKPDRCYNDITPKDMHSSMSCAWSGALLLTGSMAAVCWILLRSLWTHMRVCWDIKHTPTYGYIAYSLGWGLPLLFLTITLSVTGVSYRMGGTCIPNPHGAFATWFGWLIAFGCLAAVIQFITTGFCVGVYARQLMKRGDVQTSTSGTSASGTSGSPTKQAAPSSQFGGKRLAWRRVHKVLIMQWRSIVLSVMVIIECLYFGTVYVAQTRAAEEAAKPQHVPEIEAWSLCLITSGGDKNKCLYLAAPLGIGENTVVASLFIASLIGLFTFCLMVRSSMFSGWYSIYTLLKNRRRTRPESVGSVGDFVLIQPGMSTGASAGNGEIEQKQRAGLLPSPEKERMSVPEPGDVATRHETTNLFEESDGEDEKVMSKRRGKVVDDDVV